MTRRSLALLVAVLSVAMPVAAQQAGSFVRSGLGVRGPSLGNALAADDRAGAFYNPALAPFASGQALSLSAASRPFDREDQSIQFSAPQARAGFAVGLLRSAIAGIDGRDGSGFHTGLLSTEEYAGYLAFGLRLGQRVTGGISLQAFRSDLYDGLDPVSTIGIDLGLTVAVSPTLRLGFVLDDLLARYDWDTSGLYAEGGKATRDNFPRRIRVGVAKRWFSGRASLLAEWETAFSAVETSRRSVSLLGDRAVEFVDREDLVLRDGRFRLGLESRPVEILEVRLGLDRVRGGGARPAAGIGISQRIAELTVDLDYSYVKEPWSTGASHSAGLTLYFQRR